MLHVAVYVNHAIFGTPLEDIYGGNIESKDAKREIPGTRRASERASETRELRPEGTKRTTYGI